MANFEERSTIIEKAAEHNSSEFTDDFWKDSGKYTMKSGKKHFIKFKSWTKEVIKYRKQM